MAIPWLGRQLNFSIDLATALPIRVNYPSIINELFDHKQEIISLHFQQINQKKLMKSSSTSNWTPTPNQKLPSKTRVGEEAFVTTTTKELVEFYWSNRKRFQIEK